MKTVREIFSKQCCSFCTQTLGSHDLFVSQHSRCCNVTTENKILVFSRNVVKNGEKTFSIILAVLRFGFMTLMPSMNEEVLKVGKNWNENRARTVRIWNSLKHFEARMISTTSRIWWSTFADLRLGTVGVPTWPRSMQRSLLSTLRFWKQCILDFVGTLKVTST